VGKILLICRIAARDLRHRLAQALLLLLAIATAAATLALGLALHGVTNNPYAQTRAATNGPDVVVSEFAGRSPSGRANAANLRPFEHAVGVVAHSGPYPVTWALLRTGRTTTGAEIEGRSPAPSSVDQPKLTQGSWVRPGGVVVEAGFAEALDLHAGDRLSLGGASFEVAGIAVTAAFPSYSRVCFLGCYMPPKLANYNPGLVWLTEADAESVASATRAPTGYFLDLKLKDPAHADAFANAQDASTAPTALFLSSWQSLLTEDSKTIGNEELVLLTGSWLLALLALASVAVLVGGRMSEQTRRVGLLKAVGGTPGFVAVVLLCEHVFVGLCAAGVGLLAGWLTAPLLTGPGAGLLGAPGAPAFAASTIGLVVAMALAVAIVATFVSAVRAARTSSRPPSPGAKIDADRCGQIT
jgi:putative ABC transport system permease protein